MTFADWLSRQKRREDTVGDLARDAASDPSFPRGDNQQAYMRYFAMLPEEAQRAFKRAWEDYQEVVAQA